MRQPIGAAPIGPMVRDEDSVRPDGAHYHRLQYNVGAARGNLHPVAAGDSVLGREPRVQFQLRFGILIHQPADTARLRARKVLAYDAASREIDGKVVIHWISALAPGEAHKASLAIGMEESAVLEQPRRPRMVKRWAGPENALLLVDFFVG